MKNISKDQCFFTIGLLSASIAFISASPAFAENTLSLQNDDLLNTSSTTLAASDSTKQLSSLYNRRGLPNRYGSMKKNSGTKQQKKEEEFKLFPEVQKNSPLGAFISDSQANIELHSTYVKVTNSGADREKDWEGSSAGVKLNFESGYAFNHIGLDWSSYATRKLNRSGNRDEFSLLKQKNDGKYPRSAFYPDGRLYLKFKSGDKDNGANAKAGFIAISSDFIAGSSSYDTESSYRGINLDGNWENNHFYLIGANAIRKRVEHGLARFENAEGKRISWIGETGISHTFGNGLQLDLSYAQGKEYIKTYEVEAKYPITIAGNKLNLHGQFVRAWRGGDLWSETEDLFKSSATEMVFASDYTWNHLTFTGAYAKVKAKGGKGQLQYWLADNAYDPNNTVTSQYDDYNYDGQETFLFSTEYEVPALPGLKIGVTYVNGGGIDYRDNSNIEFKGEHELDYSLTYDFKQKYLKGLSLTVSDYNLFQKRVTSGTKRTSEIDAFLNYKVELF